MCIDLKPICKQWVTYVFLLIIKVVTLFTFILTVGSLYGALQIFSSMLMVSLLFEVCVYKYFCSACDWVHFTSILFIVVIYYTGYQSSHKFVGVRGSKLLRTGHLSFMNNRQPN